YYIDLMWLTAIVPVTAAAVLAFSLILKKKKLRAVIFTILAALFFVLGALGCYFRLVAFAKTEIIEGNLYRITGTVVETGLYSGGEYVIIDGAEANGMALSGKVIAYLPTNYGDLCDVGYKIQLYGEIGVQDVYAYGKLNYLAEENVKYRTFCYGGVVSEYRFSLFGEFRSRIKSVLFDNLSSDTAAICYAMLTGNSQSVEENAMQAFRYGGIAHVFAVSGLHIGIIFGIIGFLCKKLKFNKYVSAAICIFAVFFYSAVCGFTLSSVRAAIMCAVAIICKLLYQKYDALNSLAFAAAAILLITPLSLFSVGFQLSFCAVGGIAVISKTFERLLKKIKIPRKIASGASVSFGAQAGTLPIMLSTFGYISGAGLLLNIVIIPVLSALFVALFASAVICAIIAPLAPFVIPYVALPLELLISFLVNAGFEKALISGFGAGLFVPLYFVLLLFAGDKLNLKFLKKLIAVLCAAAVLVSYVLAKTYLPAGRFKIVVSAYYGGGEVLIKSSQGNVLVVTEGVNGDRLAGTVNKYYAGNVSAVIILGGEDCVKTYEHLNLNCKTVYIYKNYINLQPYGGVEINYEREFTVGGVNFAYADGFSILADLNGAKLAVCSGEEIPFKSCDLLVSENANTVCASLYTAYFNLSDYYYNVYDFGDLTYYADGGQIKKAGVHPPKICLN
ncbi:MAG: ComEC/Rec2 family competence protein, partial [Clostridia bacterium]|nr:ComEC/Rec2 family competence protein [Clostridia bacterium]